MKTKKIILSVFLVCILAISSVALFACSKETSSASTYKLFDETMTLIKEEGGLFTEGTIDVNISSKSSKFVLKESKDKDKSNNKNIKYDDYVIILSKGLSFIDTYYPLLQNTKVKYDFNDMKDAVKSMKSGYNTLKKEYEKLNKANNLGLDYTLYNGYFYNYREQVEVLMNRVYSVANQLGNFIQNKMKYTSKVGADGMTQESFEFYIDFNFLHFFEDYKILCLNSCKDSLYSKDAYIDIKKEFNNLFKNSLFDKKQNVDKEKVQLVKTALSAVAGNRKDVRKAMKSFSYYKYLNTYQSNLNDYQKSSQFARIYLNSITKYFNSTNGIVRSTEGLIYNNCLSH